VYKNLWIGGAPSIPEIAGKFDTLVLCAKELQGYHPKSMKVIHAPLNDAALDPKSIVRAFDAGIKVYDELQAGKKVLVTCAMGLNRSSLVAAIALLLTGMSAKEAIATIRKRRSPKALFNQHFVKLLEKLDGTISTQPDRTDSRYAAPAQPSPSAD